MEQQPDDYGERFADVFDDVYGEFVGDAQIKCLAELAGEGPVLELGVGTGRVALPLAERGLEVHGLDSSEAMLARLAAKPGGDRITPLHAALSHIPGDGRYALISCVDNTLLLLLSQEEQIRCLADAAAHLAAGGVVALEVAASSAEMDRSGGSGLMVEHVTDDLVSLWIVDHDRASQRMDVQQVVLAQGGVRLRPFSVRFVPPAELDLMARLAGLRLRDRWGGWDGEPFTSASQFHVSIYERA